MEEEKQIETVLISVPIRHSPLPQELLPPNPEAEHLLGPVAIRANSKGEIFVYCLTELNEKHPNNKHVYVQLCKTGGPLPGQKCTFLDSFEYLINDEDLHSFWWSMETNQEQK